MRAFVADRITINTRLSRKSNSRRGSCDVRSSSSSLTNVANETAGDRRDVSRGFDVSLTRSEMSSPVRTGASITSATSDASVTSTAAALGTSSATTSSCDGSEGISSEPMSSSVFASIVTAADSSVCSTTSGSGAGIGRDFDRGRTTTSSER